MPTPARVGCWKGMPLSRRPDSAWPANLLSSSIAGRGAGRASVPLAVCSGRDEGVSRVLARDPASGNFQHKGAPPALTPGRQCSEGRTNTPSSSPAKVFYICHPFGSDPTGNAERVRRICRWFAQQGYLPLAPHIYLPQFLDEVTEREMAMELCRRLIGLADELLVFGEPTSGMKMEIEEAERF